MDDEGMRWQYNQRPVRMLKPPYQQIAAMTAAMATRNRTRAAANTRKECEGLYEIDRTATKAYTNKLESDELTNLNMTRTGVAWDRNVAFWVGQCDDQDCKLCGEIGESDHI